MRSTSLADYLSAHPEKCRGDSLLPTQDTYTGSYTFKTPGNNSIPTVGWAGGRAGTFLYDGSDGIPRGVQHGPEHARKEATHKLRG